MTTIQHIGDCTHNEDGRHILAKFTDNIEHIICYSIYTNKASEKHAELVYVCGNLFGYRKSQCGNISAGIKFENASIWYDPIDEEYCCDVETNKRYSYAFSCISLNEMIDYLKEYYSYLLLPIKVAIKNE